MNPPSVSKAKSRAAAQPFRDASPWLTTDEAAARAKIGRNTLDRWVADKKVKAYNVKTNGARRGIVRFKASEIDAAIEGGAVN